MTQNDKWKVTCNGTIRNGFVSQDVIGNLAKLNIGAKQATKLIEGRPITVKKAVDKHTAETMKARLEAAGLDVSLEQLPQPEQKLSLDSLKLEPIDGEENNSITRNDAPPVNAPSLQPGQMQCPKCKTIQKKATDCSNCGVIISRYLEKQRIMKQEKDHTHQAGRDQSLETEDMNTLWGVIWGSNLGKVAVVCIALIVVFKFAVFNKSGYQALGNSLEVQAQVSAVEKAGDLQKLAPSISEIKHLIASQRFGELESTLRDLHNKMDQDILWEGPLIGLLDEISPKNGFDEKMMDQWVTSTASAWAYLARGTYFAASSVQARGTAYAEHTSNTQFQDYHQLQRIAYQDLLKAKQKDKDIMPNYVYLLIVAASQQEPPSIQTILEEAISVNPAGYYYRYQYLRNMMPKWGGSYRQMEEFTEETKPYYQLNPRLWLLQGFVSGEKARRAYDRKRYDDCITLYSEALQFGAHSGWLSHRAFCLSKEGEQELAMEDITLSLEIAENDFAKRVKRMIMSKS